MLPLSIRAYTTSNAAGIGNAATVRALREARTGLILNDLDWAPLPCWIGRVPEAEDIALPAQFAAYVCRNNRLPELSGRPACLVSRLAQSAPPSSGYRRGNLK